MTNQTTYTIISYTAGEDGWHDRCGDYHSGTDSQFELRYCTDKQEAANTLARFRLDNPDGENLLLINGVNAEDSSALYAWNSEQAIDLSDQFEEISALAHVEQNRLIKIRQEEAEQERLRIQRIEQERLEKIKKEKETAEKEQLAKLLEKYGKPA